MYDNTTTPYQAVQEMTKTLTEMHKLIPKEYIDSPGGFTPVENYDSCVKDWSWVTMPGAYDVDIKDSITDKQYREVQDNIEATMRKRHPTWTITTNDDFSHSVEIDTPEGYYYDILVLKGKDTNGRFSFNTSSPCIRPPKALEASYSSEFNWFTGAFINSEGEQTDPSFPQK